MCMTRPLYIRVCPRSVCGVCPECVGVGEGRGGGGSDCVCIMLQSANEHMYIVVKLTDEQYTTINQ